MLARMLARMLTPYSMDSLFSEFFMEFSGVILGVCETIWRLFRGHLGGIVKDFEGKTIQRVKKKATTVFFII